MAIEPVPPLTPVPLPAPQRGDRATFSTRVDAFITWLTIGVPQLADLAANVLHNAATALGFAQAAEQFKDDATDQADLALARANAAANAADAASTSAGQADANRVQTGLDRVATAANREQTEEDRQAVAAMLDSIKNGPVASVNEKTGPAVTLVQSDITKLQVISAGTVLQEGPLYGLDTSAGGFTAQLHPAPVAGMLISLLDVSGSWDSNPAILTTGGAQPIMGIAEDLVLDIQHLSLGLVYLNSTRGWVIV